MLVTIQFTLFHTPVSYLKTQILKYIKLQFYLLFFYGCEIGLTLREEHELRVDVWEESVKENIWT